MKKFDVILDLISQLFCILCAICSLITGNTTSAIFCGIFLIYNELSNIRRTMEEKREQDECDSNVQGH